MINVCGVLEEAGVNGSNVHIDLIDLITAWLSAVVGLVGSTTMGVSWKGPHFDCQPNVTVQLDNEMDSSAGGIHK